MLAFVAPPRVPRHRTPKNEEGPPNLAILTGLRNMVGVTRFERATS